MARIFSSSFPNVYQLIRISPPSGFSKVPIISIVVDFPAAFVPKKADNDPFST